jgi:hypothetical protein
MNLLRRAESLRLHFERREAILVLQVKGIWGLHADVAFQAIASRADVRITDAYLDWLGGEGKSSRVLANVRWDRASVDGRYRYPAEPLSLTVSATEAAVATFTFDAGLIRVASAPKTSILRFRLVVDGGGTVTRDLWRVQIEDAAAAASFTWLPER